MDNSLKKEMNRHIGDKALTDLYNLQKMFAHAATNKKSTKNPAQHTLTTKMTHFPALALNPAPEKFF